MTPDQQASQIVTAAMQYGYRNVEPQYTPATGQWAVLWQTTAGEDRAMYGTYKDVMATMRMRDKVASAALGPDLARRLRRAV